MISFSQFGQNTWTGSFRDRSDSITVSYGTAHTKKPLLLVIILTSPPNREIPDKQIDKTAPSPLHVFPHADVVDAGSAGQTRCLGLLPRLFAHLAEVLPQKLLRRAVCQREVQALRSKRKGEAPLALSNDLSKHTRTNQTHIYTSQQRGLCVSQYRGCSSCARKTPRQNSLHVHLLPTKWDGGTCLYV